MLKTMSMVAFNKISVLEVNYISERRKNELIGIV